MFIYFNKYQVSLEGASPNVKKDRRKFGLRKKKSSNKCSSVELAPPQIDPSGSHMVSAYCAETGNVLIFVKLPLYIITILGCLS